jgi:hypothetical protein
MKSRILRTVATPVAVVLMTFHLTIDAFHTREGVYYPVTILILTTWLCGALLLDERLSGYVLQLLGALFGVIAPYLHLVKTGGLIGGEGVTVTASPFFVWTHLALGTTSALALVLAIQGLWSLRR